jgi:hypothetical protein
VPSKQHSTNNVAAANRFQLCMSSQQYLQIGHQDNQNTSGALTSPVQYIDGFDLVVMYDQLHLPLDLHGFTA